MDGRLCGVHCVNMQMLDLNNKKYSKDIKDFTLMAEVKCSTSGKCVWEFHNALSLWILMCWDCWITNISSGKCSGFVALTIFNYLSLQIAWDVFFFFFKDQVPLSQACLWETWMAQMRYVWLGYVLLGFCFEACQYLEFCTLGTHTGLNMYTIKLDLTEP